MEQRACFAASRMVCHTVGAVSLMSKSGSSAPPKSSAACSWSGGNTSLDALASGLPLVTLPGAFMRGRQSAAMLTDLGLDELIAADAADYVEKAVALGRDRERREALAARIAEGRGRLFERDEPVRAFEEFIARAAGEGV